MKRTTIARFGFLFILLSSASAVAEDVMMATTEDIKEFDQLLEASHDRRPPGKPEDRPSAVERASESGNGKDGKSEGGGPGSPRDRFNTVPAGVVNPPVAPANGGPGGPGKVESGPSSRSGPGGPSSQPPDLNGHGPSGRDQAPRGGGH